jgi:hypothetical protein
VPLLLLSLLGFFNYNKIYVTITSCQNEPGGEGRREKKRRVKSYALSSSCSNDVDDDDNDDDVISIPSYFDGHKREDDTKGSRTQQKTHTHTHIREKQ